ncbi:hypothetical protein [Pseudomarimonas arenosa]|uniref:DUF1269 domain-containing protein n=1 Tax=Pseudomarimonas arenosa TaxID=2774145 RepID=A0AAW3ZNQ7_9GAMM|nr:hypothetical protein [Pseudomarimonas arenosa]MBD8526267.1 hypothetical protein [Pseudomarimonas arenosa]
MKIRHVYATRSLADGVRCVQAARQLGAEDRDIGLITRSESLDKLPAELKESSPTDIRPAMARGTLGGGAMGLVAGLAAMAVPGLGLTIVGAGLITLLGATVGGWSAALAGAGVPNEVHRRFEQRIEQGEVLLVLDMDEDRSQEFDQAMEGLGLEHIDYEANASLA